MSTIASSMGDCSLCSLIVLTSSKEGNTYDVNAALAFTLKGYSRDSVSNIETVGVLLWNPELERTQVIGRYRIYTTKGYCYTDGVG